jgi:hypothetical protein
MSHRLWWLAAAMSIAVSLGIVLDAPDSHPAAAHEAAAGIAPSQVADEAARVLRGG